VRFYIIISVYHFKLIGSSYGFEESQKCILVKRGILRSNFSRSSQLLCYRDIYVLYDEPMDNNLFKYLRQYCKMQCHFKYKFSP
jgi:hypothetical protein